jgi:streptogramin lyase
MSTRLIARGRSHHRFWTRARFRLEGLEDRCLLSGISSITEFPVPGCSNSPDSIVAGPDGNVWFTEGPSDAIGVINPTTDAISSFTVPTANANPAGITVGPDGNLWFTEYLGDKIGVINPATHAISEFPVPTAGARPMAITAGSSGNLWFTELAVGQIGEINLTTHAITEFKALLGGVGPIGITAGPDGNLWFTKSAGLGDINPTTGAISQFTSLLNNKGITAGADGNLWYARDVSGDAVGRINPSTDAITLFPTGSIADSQGITSGSDGNVWFTGSGQIGQINLTTDAVTGYTVPYANSSPLGITTGPDGNLWFEDTGNSAIGVATLTTSQFVVTTEPPASLTAGSGFGLTVTTEDSSGNPITTFNGTVTVAIANNPGGATLGGTLSVTAASGVATFSGLTLTKAASGYTLSVSGGGFGEGVTNAITVTPAATTQLVITTQPPATVKVSTGFGLQASIEDQYGNVVTTATNTLSVAFANNPTGATLGGTLTVTASAGVASFTNLTINKTGSGYTLQVSSTGLTSATSNPINVTRTGKTASTLVAQAGNPAMNLALAPLVLDSPDLWDGLGFKKRSHAT